MSSTKPGYAVLGGLILAVSSSLALSQQAAPAYDDPWIRGFREGKVIADVRLRYETVDDSINEDAKGLTLRTRLGYQTAPMGGFRLLGEFSDTRTLFGVDEFSPEQAGYAVIADPSQTVVNRAFISYEGFEPAWLGLGRQRIILDNARWVGNVGWRQKEQTYDAGSLDFFFSPTWTLSYDYINKVQGVTPALNRDASNHLVNLGYTGWKAGTLVAYGYFLENKEDDDKAVSGDRNDSIGLRFNGSTKPGSLTWLYTAEYARQQFKRDWDGSDFNVNYYSLMGGIGFSSVTLKLGYEVLGSDGGDYGLLTPLATLHAFNGWADIFLKTPEDGLRDASFQLGSNWLGIKWGAIYHDFRADNGSDRYGSEIDLLVAKKFNTHYTVGLKYADYRADDYLEDRKKAWLWFEFKY